jgi:hypothetical protein
MQDSWLWRPNRVRAEDTFLREANDLISKEILPFIQEDAISFVAARN